MNVERILDDRYILYLTVDDTVMLKTLAATFHKGNKSTTLKEIIEDGFQIGISVKQLFEDVKHTEEITKRYCETQIDNVHRRLKGNSNETNG